MFLHVGLLRSKLKGKGSPWVPGIRLAKHESNTPTPQTDRTEGKKREWSELRISTLRPQTLPIENLQVAAALNHIVVLVIPFNDQAETTALNSILVSIVSFILHLHIPPAASNPVIEVRSQR